MILPRGDPDNVEHDKFSKSGSLKIEKKKEKTDEATKADVDTFYLFSRDHIILWDFRALVQSSQTCKLSAMHLTDSGGVLCG